ncbi:hypothetical protein [Roseovarius nanhaiticus]|uniref:MORN repeat-containing protein n=1 Tax=Roseovarius nanhaiticus TaxID=573024 RepID=A0A1N7FX24_9RHOB|nr:hypothetical protein [Roseovarius nanhaiticus]SEK43102.1 hypothetical protein SAMN05216208_0685 [Roseovarius nanhaiticus]SIS04881.1 hypothetical protein SAMN05421666_1451 [Roseovarius nanhaiticus]
MTLSTLTRTAMAAALTLGAMTTGALAASSADELRAALVGNTFMGDMGGGGYASYFAEDGTYEDATGGGTYEITDEGVCYPGTDFGCYAAEIDGDQLEWFQNGESAGTGVIKQGNTLE